MNLRTTLILTFFFVALAVIVSLTVLNSPQRKEALLVPEEKSEQALLADVPLRADALTLEPAGQPRLSAQRKVDEWQIQTPVVAKGSPAWDNLWYALRGWNYRKAYEPGSKDYPTDDLTGLSKPRLIIRADYLQPSVYDAGAINDAAARLGTPIEPPPERARAHAVIRIGQRTSLGEATFAALGESGTPGADKVYLLQGDVLSNLKTNLSDLRNPNLVRGRNQDMREVVIEPAGQPRIVLRRDAQNHWQLVEPMMGRVDEERVNGILTQLSSIDADDWLPENDPALSGVQEGFNPPRAKVSVSSTVGVIPLAGSQPATLPTKAITLELGGFADLNKTRLYARVAGESGIARVQQSKVDKLTPTLNDLRTRSLISPDTKGVEAVHMESSRGRVNLTKRHDKWLVEQADSVNLAEDSAVNELLGQLSRLAVLQFLPPPATAPAGSRPATGLEKPEIEIRLQYAGQSTPTIIKLGAADPTGAFRPVQVNDEGPGLLPASSADVIRLDPWPYLSRSVWTLDRGRAKAVRVNRKDGEHVLTYSSTGWTLSGPSADWSGSGKINAAAVEALLATLGDLRAVSIAGAAGDEKLKFTAQDPQITIQVELPGTGGAVGPTLQPVASQPAVSQPASQPEEPPLTMQLTLAFREGRTLARIEGRPYVYELNPLVWSQADSEFADRSLGLGEASQINKISVRPAVGPVYVLVRGVENVWKVEGNDLFLLDRPRVDQLVSDLAAASADKLAAPAFEPGEKPAGITVTSGQTTKTLELGRAQDADICAKITGRPKPFLMQRGPADSLVPPLKELALRSVPVTPSPEIP